MTRPGTVRLLNWLYNLLRWGIGGIFIYAGTMKLVQPKFFAVLIDAYGIVPETLLLPLAVILSFSEMLAGMGLVFDIRGSLSVITALLGLFITILGYGIWMGLDVDCGCFGPEDTEAQAFHGLRLSFYRNMLMLAGIAFIYGWRNFRWIRPIKINMFIKQWKKRKTTEDAYVSNNWETDSREYAGPGIGRTGIGIFRKQIREGIGKRDRGSETRARGAAGEL